MKNKLIIPIILTIILSFASFPQIFSRMKYEKENNICITGIDISDISENDIKKYSVTDTAVIRENGGIFEERILTEATENFPCIALEFNADRSSDDGFLKHLRETVKKHNVLYLILREGNEKKNDHSFASSLSELIRENSLICVFFENSSQNGNEIPFGTEEFLKASDMRILRAYETPEICDIRYEKYDELYYRMLNSVQDRNTEFLLINQLAGDNGSERTLSSLKKLDSKLKELEKGKDAKGFSGYTPPHRYLYGILGGILLSGIIFLYLLYSKKADKRILYLLSALIPVGFILSLILHESFNRFLTVIYTAAVPCFMLAEINHLAKNSKIRFPVIISATIVLLLVYSLPLGAVLSGIGYHLGFYDFKWVILSLITPLVFAGFLWCYEENPKRIRKILSENKLLSIAVLFIVAIYLIRSGNTKITTVERVFRDFLSDTFSARPRLKEFALGWPCLFMSPFILRRKSNLLLTGLVLFGCTVLFSSVINSFCHGFTDIFTTFGRICAGFIVSLPLSALCGYICVIKIHNKNKKGDV